MTDTQPTHAEGIATIAELAKKARVGVLTTVDESGHLVSRPLAMQQIEFDGDLWFFTQDPSPKVDDIHGNNEVNVSFESGNGWVSIAGTASISHAKDKIDELWNKFVEAWFEDGKDDPKVALIRVAAHTAEYWDTDQPRALVLLKMAKAAVTGGTPDVGENHTVTL